MKELPLTRVNRLRIAEAFHTVPRVDMSIDCVLEDQMGKVFVDDLDSPTIFYIELGGFFAYLAGDCTGQFASKLVEGITGHIVMPSTAGWFDLFKAVHGERALPIERYRYSTERLNIDYLNHLLNQLPISARVQQIDLPTLQKSLNSPNGYISIDDFDSPEDFITRGIGFCVLHDDQIAGTAYASLMCSRGLEISIVVHPDHRRQGMATALACHLLKYGLERGLRPNWDAANPESDALARKLGYTFIEKYAALYIKPA